MAADRGDEAEVARTLPLVAEVDVRGAFGQTALHGAARGGHLGVVRQIVSAGADVNAAEHDGTTALHDAAHGGHAEILRFLLERGAKAGARSHDGTALYDAALSGSLEAVELLLARGLRANDGSNRYALTPLHGAARGGSPAIIARLLDAGGDTDAVDNADCTPLHHADTAAAADALLRAGARVDASSLWGTPLHRAAMNRRTEVARRLLAAGADPNARDRRGRTPLHVAAASRARDVAALLVKAGADYRLRDEEGRTPRDEERQQLPRTLRQLVGVSTPPWDLLVPLRGCCPN